MLPELSLQGLEDDRFGELGSLGIEPRKAGVLKQDESQYFLE
jgi:hypothetical protein